MRRRRRRAQETPPKVKTDFDRLTGRDMAACMSHVNSYMLGSMRWASPMGLAMALGKCFGTYHYVDGCGTVAEADYYVDSVRNWRGKGILCIDRESGGNAAWSDQSYLGASVARVIERTGIKPIVYGQQSILGMLQSVSAKYDCGLWVAQYADMNPTGYQDSPWNEGAFPCAIRQYSSCGSLPGWGDALDLDKFYSDVNAWSAYAGAASARPMSEAGLQPIPNQTHTGKPCYPEVYSTANATFWTSYQNNTDIGWGKAACTGHDGRDGVVEVPFKILPQSLASYQVSARAEAAVMISRASK